MGVETLPRSRREISDQDVQALTSVVRSLAPLRGSSAEGGADSFERALCAKCHTPVTGTGFIRADAIGVRRTPICWFTSWARARCTATLPLEPSSVPRRCGGIGQIGPPYLHDGPAATIEEAILRHGGEARGSVERYSALSRSKKNRLLEFVSSR